MPTSWLAFAEERPGAAWTAAPADATDDAAAAAHKAATIPTMRATAPTLALKVFGTGTPTRAAAAALLHFQNGLAMAL